MGQKDGGVEGFVASVARRLERTETWTEIEREHPELLLGSGRTLDSLPPPPTPQQVWKREHGAHDQGFITFGRDWAGPIMHWGCLDCRVAEPDCVEGKGDWAIGSAS